MKIAADLPFLLDLAKAQENARTMIAKLKDAGVTTVIFTGDPLTPSSLTKEATAQNYFPEWVIGSNVLVDIALFGRTYDQQQWQHAFGLALTPARTNEASDERVQPLQVGVRRVAPPNNTYGVIIAGPDAPVPGHPARGAGPDPGELPGRVVPLADPRRQPAQPQLSRGQPRPVARRPTTAGPTTPGSSGGTRTPRARTRSARSARASTSTRRWASATRSTRCRPRTRASSIRRRSITIFETIPQEFALPDYPSPAK